jgi:hypothetical protein
MKQYLVTQEPRSGYRETYVVLTGVFSAESKAGAIRQFDAMLKRHEDTRAFVKAKATEFAVGKIYCL